MRHASILTLILEGIDLASVRRLCRPPSLRSNVTCCRAAYLPQLATVDARGRSTRIAENLQGETHDGLRL